MLVAAGKVAWYNPGDKTTLQRWVLEELGSILNIKRGFIATLRSEVDHGVALSLQPFDVKSWVAIVGGDLRKTFEPLSVVLQVPHRRAVLAVRISLPGHAQIAAGER